MTFPPEVRNSPAVAGDQSLESPFVTQDLLQVACIAAARLTVDALIGTHHLLDVTLLHQSFEGWEIGFPEVAFGQLFHIERVAVPFRSAVHRIVLGTCQRLQVFLSLTLQTAYHGQSHLRSQERVFAVGLLTTSPSWVAEDVDVGRIERQPLILADIVLPACLCVLRACLIAHRREHPVYQVVVEGGGHTHRDGEDRSITTAPHAMQGLVPPLEGRDT